MILDIKATNENLKVGDKVFPLANGQIKANGTWSLRNFNFDKACTGYPDDPHTILDLHYSKDKAYEIRTDKGYGPVEQYFKLI